MPGISGRTRIFLFIGLSSSWLALGQGAELSLERVDAELVAHPLIHYVSVKASSSGEMYFMAGDRWTIHKVVRPSLSLEAFNLHNVPETRTATVKLADDFAVDRQGYVYVPASWRSWTDSSKRSSYGIIVLDPKGEYSRTIHVPAESPVFRIAVDAGGNLYTLGPDLGYFQGKNDGCNLLRKYSPGGQLLTASSECPGAFKVRRKDRTRQGTDFRRLQSDLDSGLLWAKPGRVYQVLPLSRLLRVFDTEGKLLQQASLEPPTNGVVLGQYGLAPGAGSDIVWRAVDLPEGRFLVEWQHSDRTGSARTSLRYISLHDAQGRALTPAIVPPWKPSFPLSSDDSGNCYFLWRSAPNSVELVKARVTLR